MAVELADAQVRRDAHASLERRQRNLRLLRESLLRHAARDVRRDARHCLRVHLRGVEHGLGAFLAGEKRRGRASFALFRQRPLDAREGEVFVIRRLHVAFDVVGVRDFLERRQVRHARHRHDIAGGRVVAEREERQRARRPLRSSDERGEGRVSHAVELARGHVARAGGVVVHRVVEAVEREQLAAELAVELLVAHAAGLVLVRRRELVRALREDVAFLVEAVHFVDALGVHQVGRVPAARGIEDEVERPLVRRLFLHRRAHERGHAAGAGEAESGEGAEF